MQMRTTGKVKWFSDEKGFGFITPDGVTDSKQNCFVHFASIEGVGHKTLAADQRVEFDIVQQAKGPAAVNIHVLA